MFLQSMSIYQFILPNSYCACAETATSELSVKILTPPLNSATLISYMVYGHFG